MAERFPRVARFVFRFHRAFAIVFHLTMVVVANSAAFLLRFDGAPPQWAFEAFLLALPWLVGIRAATFVAFRLYEGLWRYTSLYDLRTLVLGVTTSSLLFFGLIQSPLGPEVYPRSLFILDPMLLLLLCGGARMSRRLVAEFSVARDGKRVLVYGAGDAGELIVRDMKNSNWYGYQPIGFIDDNRDKVRRRIHGVPVLGTRHELPAILAKHKPHEILIAIPTADPMTIRAIVRTLEPFKVPIKTLPNLRDLLNGKVELSAIRSLSVEDLLARAPVGLDVKPLKTLIQGRSVMVTGAGGSIGSELCRQIAKLKPSSLVMFERYENSLHAIRMELEDSKLAFGLHPVVADVTDETRVHEVMQRYVPEIVFHAAAHKHVPLMEENPCEAIKNNVRGTRVLAAAAEANGVDRFIFISTDKAVNPTSVMGASKRVAELVIQAQAQGSGTSFAIVRFGNVLGSNGSVVPRFMEQIRKGGPVTVTHPEMRRFFMLIPEAVQLVLHAASQAEGGATYVLEMGDQVKLVDMARNLIRLSGLVPDDDIKIEFCGLRPGEKLYEELVGEGEEASPSAVDKILCVRSRRRVGAELMAQVQALEADAFEGRREPVLAVLEALAGSAPPQLPQAEPDTVVANVQVVAAAQAADGSNGDLQPCPQCGCQAHRSRARGLHERVRKGFTSSRLYRCDDCGWRGWLVPLAFGDRATVNPAAAPDLASLDFAVKPAAPRRRQSFSPRNLH